MRERIIPCCTCRMGNDDMSVVDELGRVHTLRMYELLMPQSCQKFQAET